MSRRSLLLLLATLITVFLLIIGRLFQVQVLRGDKYKRLSKRNYLRVRDLYPPRGDILDRNGEKLAYDEPRYVLSLDYRRLSEEELKKLSRNLLEVFNIDLEKLLKENRGGVEPIRLKEDLSQEDLDRYYSNAYKLPGVFVEVVPKRVYPHGKLLCHVIGYVGYPSKEELKKYGSRIGSRSFVGKLGIERSMDPILLGELGREEVMINAVGKVVKTINRKEPVKGNSITLTVDARIQKIVEDVFYESGQPAGAVVLLNAKTGEVLALASFPGYDPNMVYKDWKKITKNKLKPMFNRATSGRYPPASVLKVPVSYAILETRTASPWDRVLCTGSYFLGDRRFYCWDKSGHGSVNMVKALQESCDVYYYTYGYEMGPSTIVRYARKFGYGESIPLEIPVKRGFLPTPEWKRRRFKEPWYDGDTVNLSIGQGFMLSTLMEQTLMMMGIVNNGVIYRPTLVRDIRDPSGKVLWKNKRKVWKVIKGRQEHFAIIRRGLREAVKRGTGARAFSRMVDIAGKTGTAQVAQIKRGRKRRRKVPWKLRDHAWFVGFAPYRDPLFVIGVLVEHGESGGRTAAPIARRIMERIYMAGLNKEL
ncbi:MAG: penicillin-binding protein 2 [Aquificae bacterium]|nr:penicillin-binding protein 2 [Aquificota bacterium]